MLKILQLNCGRSFVSMCDVGQVICECVSVALIQEPYNVDGQIRGIPLGMKSFMNKNGKSAIIVNDPTIECILVDHLTDDFGVCVLLKCSFGNLLCVSVSHYGPLGIKGTKEEEEEMSV